MANLYSADGTRKCPVKPGWSCEPSPQATSSGPNRSTEMGKSSVYSRLFFRPSVDILNMPAELRSQPGPGGKGAVDGPRNHPPIRGWRPVFRRSQWVPCRSKSVVRTSDDRNQLSIHIKTGIIFSLQESIKLLEEKLKPNPSDTDLTVACTSPLSFPLPALRTRP